MSQIQDTGKYLARQPWPVIFPGKEGAAHWQLRETHQGLLSLVGIRLPCKEDSALPAFLHSPCTIPEAFSCPLEAANQDG